MKPTLTSALLFHVSYSVSQRRVSGPCVIDLCLDHPCHPLTQVLFIRCTHSQQALIDNTATLTSFPGSSGQAGLCTGQRYGHAFSTTVAFNLTRLDIALVGGTAATTALDVLVEVWTSTGAGGTTLSALPIASTVALGTGLPSAGGNFYTSLALTAPLLLATAGQYAVTFSPQTSCTTAQYACWRPSGTSTPTAGTSVAYVGAVYSTSGAAGSWSAIGGSRCVTRLMGTIAST